MTSPSNASASPAVPVDVDATLLPGDRRDSVAPLARAVLAHALAMGVAADLLLRDGFSGLGYPLWLALLALSALSLAWRGGRRLPLEAGAWLVTALLFGAAMVWRDGGFLQFLDFLATLVSIGMAAIALGDARAALAASRLRDTVWAAFALALSVAAGLVPFALRDLAIARPRPEVAGRFRTAVRAALIALPLLVVFGALLRGADPVFASLLALPDIDVGTLVSHGVVIGFFTWVVAGWARGALIGNLGGRRAPERLPFSIGLLDVTAALGGLIALFALYVVTQLGWFFGGERFLQARTGLTAAEYARQGFFQMMWVVLLVVPVLMGTRAALRPGWELERRHTMLALPIIGLLGVMIVSAVLRLRLYVHYFGLTTDRLYALVFMGWLALVLGWLAVTVLRGAGQRFVAGAMVSGLSVLAVLNAVVPDVVVARVNLARASAAGVDTAPLDVAYLSHLSAEAVPLVLPAVLAPTRGARGSAERMLSDRARCTAARRLSAKWKPEAWPAAGPVLADAQWRRWNLAAAEASLVIGRNAPALRGVLHDTCRKRPT